MVGTRVIQYTRSVRGRQTGVVPWGIVTARPYVSIWDMWADHHGGVVSWPFVSLAVLWCVVKAWVDRLDRDRPPRPVATVTDSVNLWPFVSLQES